jgi:RNA polymerase sigma factor (sigma-70 family)
VLHKKNELARNNLNNRLGKEEPVNNDSLPGKQQLSDYLQEQSGALLKTLHFYVLRSGITIGEQVSAVALEILQETVVEAFAHADRYRIDSQPMAWLLGIALNMIRRRKVSQTRRSTREISLGWLSQQKSQPVSEADLLDQLTTESQVGPEEELAARQSAQALLALVSSDDQRVLRLALLEGYDNDALATRLAVAPGAARTRLYRALKRLRSAWFAHQPDYDGVFRDE